MPDGCRSGRIATCASPAIADIARLRRQTKDMQQAIAFHLAALRDRTPITPSDVDEALRHIAVTSAVADTLFGATSARTTFAATLREICRAASTGPRGPDRDTQVDLFGACPTHLHRAVFNAAHECVAAALRSGTAGRTGGRAPIRLRVRRWAGLVSVTMVTGPDADFSDELAHLQQLAFAHGGRARCRPGHRAVLRVSFPISTPG